MQIEKNTHRISFFVLRRLWFSAIKNARSACNFATLISPSGSSGALKSCRRMGSDERFESHTWWSFPPCALRGRKVISMDVKERKVWKPRTSATGLPLRAESRRNRPTSRAYSGLCACSVGILVSSLAPAGPGSPLQRERFCAFAFF